MVENCRNSVDNSIANSQRLERINFTPCLMHGNEWKSVKVLCKSPYSVWIRKKWMCLKWKSEWCKNECFVCSLTWLIQHINHVGECVQVFVLPFGLIQIFLSAFSVASSFSKNEVEHLALTVIINKCKDHLLLPSTFLQNSSQRWDCCAPYLHITLQKLFGITVVIFFHDAAVVQGRMFTQITEENHQESPSTRSGFSSMFALSRSSSVMLMWSILWRAAALDNVNAGRRSLHRHSIHEPIDLNRIYFRSTNHNV